MSMENTASMWKLEDKFTGGTNKTN